LDGELWMGRETFQQVISLINTKSGNWSQLGYFVFDLPDSSEPWETRKVELDALEPLLPSHVHIVHSIERTGMEHLNSLLEATLNLEAEGLMARAPYSLYTAGLTNSLLKLKVILFYPWMISKRFQDAELKVVQILNSGLYCQQYNQVLI